MERLPHAWYTKYHACKSEYTQNCLNKCQTMYTTYTDEEIHGSGGSSSVTAYNGLANDKRMPPQCTGAGVNFYSNLK